MEKKTALDMAGDRLNERFEKLQILMAGSKSVDRDPTPAEMIAGFVDGYLAFNHGELFDLAIELDRNVLEMELIMAQATRDEYATDIAAQSEYFASVLGNAVSEAINDAIDATSEMTVDDFESIAEAISTAHSRWVVVKDAHHTSNYRQATSLRDYMFETVEKAPESVKENALYSISILEDSMDLILEKINNFRETHKFTVENFELSDKLSDEVVDEGELSDSTIAFLATNSGE
jgi:hypothetical protein